MKFTTSEILDKLNDRDSRIIHEIRAKCFPMIYNMVKKTRGQKEDAEDIFQQAMLIIILRCKDTIILSCGFRTFLIAICRNLWNDALKSKRYLRKYRDSLSLTEPVYFLPDGTDIIKLQKTFQDICAQLTEKKRKVLEMHMAGLPQKEIAASLETSHSYIRKMVHNIKKDIKQRVADDPGAIRVVEEYILNK